MFIDRDGTLNEEMDFIRTPDDLKLINGAAASVRKLNERGLATVVISNQSGVARGYLTEEDLARIHEKLIQELSREGASVDRIYYCPHHPTDGNAPYNNDCECRKPKPGMLKRAEKDLGIDLRKSFVVGDSVVDMQAGAAVGATTILVLTGYGKNTNEERKRGNISVDVVVESIQEAVDHILQKIGKGEKKQNA
ncbi:MAG: D-glycero-beta-D-manno-heptose 1,7-bisphosphate 7-phosphatase [Ignavibacteriae bacterium]|nr:D-glycero-beta-D-manno-heptose 1,7-bisphosphate 7-phosphatase [Ignavibacteriota bacterium]